MFEAVGKKFHSIKRSCKGEDWFMKYSWTEAEEKKFRDWLKEYIVKKMGITAKLADKHVAMFCFQYGWTYKEEKK